MKTMILIILTAAITNNYVLVKFLGICPFLGVSKKLDQATGMSLAVIFVEVLATAVTWPIYHFLLAGKVDFTYMETVVFILVIAALVQLVEIVLKRYVPSLHKSLGVYLPLITTNCGVLGVTMNVISDGMNYGEALLTALGCGLGFTLAICAMAAIRETLGGGTFCGLPVPWFHENPIGILTMAPGGFFVFGCMIALINKLSKGRAIKKKEFGCAGCPGCGKGSCEGKEAAAK